MLTMDRLLPHDRERATLVGRVWDPAERGPALVVVAGDDAVDITDLGPTCSKLLERHTAAELRAAAAETGRRRWSLTTLIEAFGDERDPDVARLLSPVDLQVLKAAGVTFVESMVERVIEERAQGDLQRAEEIRGQLAEAIGGAIAQVKPGSEAAEKVKQILVSEGLWSQYLEVGIGPDPEIFTKAPVLSSVGVGATIGVLSRSAWNNPEPEVALVARADGTPVGAMLGNDVNLRDFEGRSALLLTEAKDNNASCALGPFIRLFDDAFTMDDVRALDVHLSVEGPEGFRMDGVSSMSNISRDPLELIGHTRGAHHHYPDGFVLLTGTLFAPTQDRHGPGQGFTHVVGDVVRISAGRLGELVNVVDHAETAPPWTFGIWDLVESLHRRSLLAAR